MKTKNFDGSKAFKAKSKHAKQPPKGLTWTAYKGVLITEAKEKHNKRNGGANK
jgi:hypothetical protein